MDSPLRKKGMQSLLAGFSASLAALVCCDALWLGLIARSFYKARLGSLLLDRPLWTAAILFYFIHAVGMTVFVVRPALAADSPTTCILRGALFGLCAYATYDLSNLATLRGWSATVTAIDIGWGVVATAAASLVGFLLARWAFGH
jgi:uncharacterized membrane protein